MIKFIKFWFGVSVYGIGMITCGIDLPLGILIGVMATYFLWEFIPKDL